MLFMGKVMVLFILVLTRSSGSSRSSEGYTYTSNPLTLTTHVGRQKQSVINATHGLPADVGLVPVKQVHSSNSSAIVKPPATCSGKCDELPAQCYECNATNNCKYGGHAVFPCEVIAESPCIGSRVVQKEFICVHCYLTRAKDEHVCIQSNTSCKVASTPRQRVKMTCTVNEDVFCLGRRTFSKMTYCDWTAGYKWSTAVILSITLGGFGVDRFYLGYWKGGLGKLFSFGGLGVWTLIDIVLIVTSYLGPADGSIYIT